jgi:hypothetical protein
MPVLRIPPHLYKRLEAHAEGFDTPAQVIERILNAFEGKAPVKTSDSSEKDQASRAPPALSFYPSEQEFRSSLLNGHKNTIVIHYQDGSFSNKSWHSNRFNQSSNLRGNIWSGFLRGWKTDNIIAAEFHAKDAEVDL